MTPMTPVRPVRPRRGVAGAAVALRVLAVLALASVVAAFAPVELGPGSAGVARADGDPASDVLLGQDVFLPYTGISVTLQRRLFEACAAARRAGFPVKVALISSRADLGVVPALFDRPQAYARFLSAELGSVVRGPVLVVMPSGLGLAAQGHALPTPGPAGSSTTAGGPDVLASAALSAVPRVAAAAGHPLPASGASSTPGAGASPATVRHALIAMLVLGLLSLVAISGAFVARSRRTTG
jgi:hypothetical protein